MLKITLTVGPFTIDCEQLCPYVCQLPVFMPHSTSVWYVYLWSERLTIVL